MSRLKRALMLTVAGASACLIALSCTGPKSPALQESPALSGQAGDSSGMPLPPPSEIRLPAETNSEYLRYAQDFAADLPFHNVGIHADKLRYIPAKQDPLAFALYWLLLPDEPLQPTVLLDPGFDNGGAWVGIANFSTDRWDFGLPGEQEYDSRHDAGGMILVAVVSETYDELSWLVAGGQSPPFVHSVSPAVLSAGSSSEARVQLMGGSADSYSWQFGGGLSITQSVLAKPQFNVLTAGEYSGSITVANEVGSTTYDFDYSVVPATQYEPLHLYAVSSKSTVAAGEEFTISIRTGLIPEQLAAVTARVALLFPVELQYVPDSFNTGAPGGEQWGIDGFWALQPSEEAFFLTYPDSWLKEVPDPGTGLHHMEISLAAAYLNAQYGSGVLCNLKLKCDTPGTYALSFLEETDVVVTSFTTLDGDVLWHDISNEGAPAIVVTE